MPARTRFPGRFAFRLVTAMGASLLAACAVEAALRLFAPQPLALGYLMPDRLTLHIPGAHVRYARSEFDHVVDVNSLGLRDREVSRDKPSGLFRILVLGDSYAEGKQVAFDEIFTERVEALLSREVPGRRWEVVNAGVSGYGTADEVEFFERYGRRLQPDLVILAFTIGNDVHDNLETSFFRWRDGRLIETNPPPLSLRERIEARVKEFLSSRFHLVQFLRDRLHELQGRGEGAAAAALARHRAALFATGGARSEVERGWAMTVALLDRLREDVEHAGSGLMVVAIPLRVQLEQSGTAPPQSRLAAWAASHGVPYVDLLPALRRAGSDTYFRVDGHFNSRGHEVAAREIYQALVAHRLLPLA
jgi:lysophospholipase L1-like esterase